MHSQFYTDLVSELYEPLVSTRAKADDYVSFIERAGQPVLELGCGPGLPMLDLVERGYNVEGLDASADMLEQCRANAAKRNLQVTLYHQEMQAMSLPKQYAAIFLAGPTLNLIISDDDAVASLQGIYAHLRPGGQVLIPLMIERPEAVNKENFGKFKETKDAAGALLRVGAIDGEFDEDKRLVRHRLRYEKIHPDGREESLERDWFLHWWPQAEFRQYLENTGFTNIRARRFDGKPVDEDDDFFVFLCEKEG
ncbi:MAG: class I SAM-dependent methyltransferase [Pseudomonadota bacterium]